MSRDKLMELARGREHESFDRSIDVQVSRLRKLLGEDPHQPRFIQTRLGLRIRVRSRRAACASEVLPAIRCCARTLIVVVAALVLSQAASLYLLHEYVTQPRNAYGMRQFVSHLKTMSAALQTMSPEQQSEFIGRIAEKEGLRIIPVRGNEGMRPAPDVPPVRMFRERVRDIFGAERGRLRRAPVENPDESASGRARTYCGSVFRPASASTGSRSRAGASSAIPRPPCSSPGASRGLRHRRRSRPSSSSGASIARWPSLRAQPTAWAAAATHAPSRRNGALGRCARWRAPSTRCRTTCRKASSDRATFLAGVSHDLRTPLSRLRLELEMQEGRMEPATRTAMVEDLDDMNAIIDQFIDFMRERGVRAARRP